MNSALQYAAARHVTVVVASGDQGAIGNGSTAPVKQVILPTSDPLVLAAGGTSLTANPVTGAYISETAWSDPGNQPSASGGGFSRLFARPAYQDGVPGIGAPRGVPDVAADAWHHRHGAHVQRAGRRLRAHRGRRHQRRRAVLGRADRPGRPGRPATRSASSTRPSTGSPAARSTTRRSTTSPPATTPWSSTGSLSPATRPDPAGTRSPAGAAPTPRSSSPCSPAEAPRNVLGSRGHRPGNGAPPWTVTFPGKDLAAARQTGQNRDRLDNRYAEPAEGGPQHSTLKTRRPTRGRSR